MRGMSRPVSPLLRHTGEARYRIRTINGQLERLESAVLRVAAGEAMDAERLIDVVREHLAILEADVKRWRLEQLEESDGR